MNSVLEHQADGRAFGGLAIARALSWLPLLLVISATVCVAYADYVVRTISLGYLYVLPLCLAAIVLSRRNAFGLVAVCVLAHDLFGPGYPTISARVLHNLTAAISFVAVVLVLQHFVAQRNALFELTTRQRDELMKEVELAAQVQKVFLPAIEPAVPGFNVAAASYPARFVGGDYFDYIQARDGALDVVMADVAGHGAAAALLMAATAAVVNLLARDSKMLVDVVYQLNRDLRGFTGESRFVTLFLAELQPATRSLRYVNCGHEPALLFQPVTDTVRWLSASCVPIGLFPTIACETNEVGIGPGDVLLCYTDGLTEAENGSNVEFGRDRISQVVRDHAAESAHDIVNAIYAAAIAHRGSNSFEDDLTIMAIKAD
jgi:serine phosphatase RsbU (regulator of sigma subunit)